MRTGDAPVARKRKPPDDRNDQPADPTPPPAESVDAIIARNLEAKAAKVREDQEREEEPRRRRMVLNALDSACRYILATGTTTDPGNWVGDLYQILQTAAPFVEGDILSKISKEGGASWQVLLAVCDLVQKAIADERESRHQAMGEKCERARLLLARAFAGNLSADLWKDLSGRFPEEVSRLLPDDLREQFQAMLAGPVVVTLPLQEQEAGPRPPKCIVALVDGGFSLRGGEPHPLTPRERQMLEVLLDSRHYTARSDLLREEMGVDKQVREDPAQIIKDTAKRLRSKLRKALGLPHKGKDARKAQDPLPSTSQDKYLAYGLGPILFE
jgi:hypothetical protein